MTQRILHAARCCPCQRDDVTDLVSSHSSLAAAIPVSGTVMCGLNWSELASTSAPVSADPLRRNPLVVKPVFTYPLPVRQEQSSWRNWGGIQSQADVDQEAARIQSEMDRLSSDADFPVRFLPLAVLRRADELRPDADVGQADVLLVYAAGDGGGDLMAAMNPLMALGKNMILFIRHKSGPLYYWYEGMMARFLHQHTDSLACRGADYDDVVTDRVDEILWRLRALAGLKNTQATRIVAIGRAGGWGPNGGKAPELASQKWQIDAHTVSYKDLGRLLDEAFANSDTVAAAHASAEAYLRDAAVKSEVPREAVDNAFVLERVFRALMDQADARSITISGCMRTVMPISRTSACLALSVLNDAGYLAFCESDFVAIPAGLLMSNIAGRPSFLNDPTYPHAGVITLAHCTAPRRMNGKDLDPARLLTHFESDYGVAPKVEFRKGQVCTSIIPDFAQTRWTGLAGEIAGVPSLDICRSQMEMAYRIPDDRLADAMSGFHWVTIYGDYLREIGYALKKTAIGWNPLA